MCTAPSGKGEVAPDETRGALSRPALVSGWPLAAAETGVRARRAYVHVLGTIIRSRKQEGRDHPSMSVKNFILFFHFAQNDVKINPQ